MAPFSFFSLVFIQWANFILLIADSLEDEAPEADEDDAVSEPDDDFLEADDDDEPPVERITAPAGKPFAEVSLV